MEVKVEMSDRRGKQNKKYFSYWISMYNRSQTVLINKVFAKKLSLTDVAISFWTKFQSAKKSRLFKQNLPLV
jgi:hypothetical protein